MRFGSLYTQYCGQMNDCITLIDQLPHQLGVADVALDERVMVVVLKVSQILRVARVGQAIKIRNLPVGPVVAHKMNEVGPDESAAASNKQMFTHVIAFRAVTGPSRYLR